VSFILHDIVSEIYDAYELLPGGRDPIRRDEYGLPMFGNLEKAKHGSPGKIVWMLQGGNFGSPVLAGTEESPAKDAALCRFLVWIWSTTLETGWNEMCDIIAAIKRTIHGRGLGLLAFTVPTELEGRHLHCGELYVLDVTLNVPIPSEGSVPLTLTILESHESTVTEDNGQADEDGDFTAFETVIVTGPPT
jgi:hypothetical protein